MDSTRRLKVCCGIWHQDVSSRSFKSCKFRGGASMDRTCLSSTSNRCSLGSKSGEYSVCVCAPQTIPEPLLLCGTAHHPAERGHSHQGIGYHRVFMVCNNAYVGGTCQSSIHMDGRTQGFPAEHCPKHHTTNLSSCHSASWSHVFHS